MRFLVDACLSPRVAAELRRAGHDAAHVGERAMLAAPDPDVLDRAVAEGRVLVSADTDFGALLARRRTAEPSVVLFRRPGDRRPEDQALLLLENLSSAALAEALDAGAVAVFDEDRVRVRPLPILPS